MKYSIVELAPVLPGSGKRDALARAIAAAEEADVHGYHRIWYAEHHHVTGYASQDPAPLIAAAVQRTSRIRVGSGAVLLNHHSPFTVAERFLLLEALAPGRVDLGVGRSSAGPLVDHALRLDRASERADDFPARVKEIVSYYHRAFEEGHPFGSIDLTHGIDGLPEVWVLGSSVRSADVAGRLGLGYTYGGHINPDLIRVALDEYRSRFEVTPFGSGVPQPMLALNIVAADDESTAHSLTWPARALRSAGRDRPIPTLRQAAAELTAEQKAAPSVIDAGFVPPQIAGTPESLRAQLEPLVQETGVGEIMVQDMLTDPQLRQRSRELIAQTLASIGVRAGAGTRS